MKKMNSSLIVCTLTLASLVSCAGPENYTNKISQYTPKVVGRNQVPDLKTDGFQFTEKKLGRGPASAGGNTPVSIETPVENDNSLSNKKLYFLTLFGQYEIMKKYAQDFAAPNVNICPNFHTSLLEHNGRKPTAVKAFSGRDDKKFIYDIAKLNDADYVGARAELSLPLSKDEVTPKVVDILRSDKNMTDFKMNELVHQAIDIHLSKTYSEIRELCEFGVSDNYYIYENLITHIKNSEFKAASTNMNTLLKTTLFSNLALVTTLEKKIATPSRGIASFDGGGKSKDFTAPYTNEVMTRLNVEWAKEYFDHLKTSR
jgi:hypothetical protein